LSYSGTEGIHRVRGGKEKKEVVPSLQSLAGKGSSGSKARLGHELVNRFFNAPWGGGGGRKRSLSNSKKGGTNLLMGEAREFYRAGLKGGKKVAQKKLIPGERKA